MVEFVRDSLFRRFIVPRGGGAAPVAADVFKVLTYTGNDGTNAITGAGFQSDAVWLKGNGIVNHVFSSANFPSQFDQIYPSLSNGLTGFAEGLKTFDSDGFTVEGTNLGWNKAATSYDALCFKKTVGVFDEVFYTGNGSNRSVAHSLGVVPEMIIVKKLTGTIGDTTSRWAVYHKDAADVGALNNDSAFDGFLSSYFNGTSHTDSIFTIGTSTNSNENTATFVAYLFASLSGVSKVFSYTGDGLSSGPKITMDFQPSFVMLKRETIGGSSWFMINTERNPDLNGDEVFEADTTVALLAKAVGNFESDGFQIDTTDNDVNASGSNYVGVAFA